MKVTDYLTQKALLGQLAEECTELAHVCLKGVRYIEGDNPTPMSYDEFLAHLNEEMADVELCMKMITISDRQLIEETMRKKEERWLERLGGGAL